MLILDLVSERWIARQEFAVLDLVVHHLTDTLSGVFCFELGDGHQLVDDQSALWCGAVINRLPDRKPGNVVLVEDLLRVDIMTDGSEPTVELRKDDFVDFAVLDILQQFLQLITVDLGSAGSSVNVFAHADMVFVGIDVFLQGRELGGN